MPDRSYNGTNWALGMARAWVLDQGCAPRYRVMDGGKPHWVLALLSTVTALLRLSVLRRRGLLVCSSLVPNDFINELTLPSIAKGPKHY